MKFISIAIALLVSAAIVASHPVYGDEDDDHEHREETSTSSTPWYYPSESPTSTSDTESSYETNAPSNEDSSEPTYCDGFKITNPSEGASYTSKDVVEVTFDYTGSNVSKVEMVDLVTYDSHHLIDEWATGPWNSSDSGTGSHGLHIHSDESGDFQFRVIASTVDHHHCKYYSPKFTITYAGDDHSEDTTSTSSYDDATSTYSDPSESTY